MTFFNKKEEVMDIQLTRFGRASLARGSFRPTFYQFFDDDILYESSAATFSEHQNDSEKRILEDTPRLKTQSITFPLEKEFELSPEVLELGSDYSETRRIADPSIQDRILLYPIESYNIESIDSPRFTLRSHDQKFIGDLSYLKLQGSGIIKNIPQISIEPEYTIRSDRENLTVPKMLNQETYIDISSRDTRFLDNSAISVTSKDIVVLSLIHI